MKLADTVVSRPGLIRTAVTRLAQGLCARFILGADKAALDQQAAIAVDADERPCPADLFEIEGHRAAVEGTQGTLKTSLQTIRDITNPTVVVMRVSNADNVDVLDELLACQSRLGVIPKILGAPEIDTPAVVRKLVSIAKRRRGFVYASPRKDDGTLITDKTEIAAYRDTFGDRELHLIENQWGKPLGK